MLKDVGLDLLASKKLMVAILAMVAAAAARIGLHFTATEALAFISPFLAYIGAQGYADGGKSVAQINERTALHQLATTRARSMMPLETQAQIDNAPAPAVSATGIRVAAGAGIVVLAALMIFGTHAGCGATTNGTGGSSLATGGKSWLACEKADLGKLVDGTGGLTLLGAVASDLMASNYADLIETMIAKFGGDAIGCAVLAVEAVAKAQKPPVNAMPTPLEIRASEMIQKYGWRPATTAVKP